MKIKSLNKNYKLQIIFFFFFLFFFPILFSPFSLPLLLLTSLATHGLALTPFIFSLFLSFCPFFLSFLCSASWGALTLLVHPRHMAGHRASSWMHSRRGLGEGKGARGIWYARSQANWHAAGELTQSAPSHACVSGRGTHVLTVASLWRPNDLERA